MVREDQRSTILADHFRRLNLLSTAPPFDSHANPITVEASYDDTFWQRKSLFCQVGAPPFDRNGR